MRVRLFVDFWNFSLNFNERSKGQKTDWKKVPATLFSAAQAAISSGGLGKLELEETRVYASYEAGRNGKLRDFLFNFLDKQPGVRVFTTARRWRSRPVYCRNCQNELECCPSCNAPFGRAAEKGVDSQIVTDLMGLAWEGAYDVALLLSSDADFVPAVEHLQAKNIKVVNATWKGHGHELARVCWASFLLDHHIDEIVR